MPKNGRKPKICNYESTSPTKEEVKLNFNGLLFDFPKAEDKFTIFIWHFSNGH